MLITRRHLVAGAAASAVLPSALAPLGASAAVTNLKVTDLYAGGGELSKVALDLQGKDVQFQGYMAPPLKADSKFFVLTTIPMAVCPFCAEITEWPEDIVVIYTNRAIEEVPFEIKVNAFGKLDLGPADRADRCRCRPLCLRGASGCRNPAGRTVGGMGRWIRT